MALFNDFRQRLQTAFDIFDLGLVLPVFFRREINDGLFISDHRLLLEYEHTTDFELFRLAGGIIGREIIRILVLELQRNSFTHNTDSIHGIDERFGFGGEHISCRILYHG